MTEALVPAPKFVRVVVQHAPNYYALLGVCTETECTPQVTINNRTYCRVQSTDRWVLYKPAQ